MVMLQIPYQYLAYKQYTRYCDICKVFGLKFLQYIAIVNAFDWILNKLYGKMTFKIVGAELLKMRLFLNQNLPN
jgi:hypothetical protein